MRKTPSYIAKALKDYDPLLSMKWETESLCWKFCYRGKALFAYKHADGTLAQNADGNLDEIIHIVRKSDWHNRDRALKHSANIRARVKDSDARTVSGLKEDASRESGKMVKCSKRGGAKPFVDFSSLKKNLNF